MSDDEELREAIRREASGGTVSCKALLELAEWQDVSPRKVGRLCDQMKIKIVECQLGCFR
jgi:hypothetical protein